MELFEKLIEKFLREKNVPKEEFYSQIQEHVHRDTKNSKSKRDEAKKRAAEEVVDVIFCYTDLRLWCGEMRKRAVMQLQHNEYLRQKARGVGAEVPAPRKTQLQEVAEAHGVSTPLVLQSSPSTSHRFDVT